MSEIALSRRRGAAFRHASGERRHATIVFSDLSGYTVLNERIDPYLPPTLLLGSGIKCIFPCSGTRSVEPALRDQRDLEQWRSALWHRI
jgi:hypothetical protein